MIHLALAASIVTALFCATVAGCKNRDVAGWVLLGLALPLVAMLLIIALPARDEG